MKQESLREASSIIIEAISNSNIEQRDKLELMMNLYLFIENYYKAIKHDFKEEKDESNRFIK